MPTLKGEARSPSKQRRRQQSSPPKPPQGGRSSASPTAIKKQLTRERETDEEHSSTSSDRGDGGELLSPAAAPASTGFLSHILSKQKPTKLEDVKSWLQYGGASTAAEQAIEQADGGALASADDAEAAPAAEEEEPMASPASAPVKPWYDEPEAPPDAAIFVHFIPPPMRENGKKDLSWIIHTCDGSGCREARHVSFNSICGFSTFEGAPPEQAEGTACSCQIANHHLRGFGRVRWDKRDRAVIEHHQRGDEHGGHEVMLNVKAVRDEARHRAQQLGRANAEVKKLRELTTTLSHQLDSAIAANGQGADGAVKELATLKMKRRDLDERHRGLQAKFDALTAAHADLQAEKSTSEQTAAAATLAAECHAAEARRVASEMAAAAERMAGGPQVGIGPWRCLLVCLPAQQQEQKGS